MVFPASKLFVVVELALGADLTALPSTWVWTDVSHYVRFEPGITIQRGRTDEFSTFQPCQITLTVDNRTGRFCTRNPTGAYYPDLRRNTPLRVRVKLNSGDAYTTQALAYLSDLPLFWDKTARNAWVQVTAAGVLRRLAQSPPLRSAAYRTNSVQAYANSIPAIAYWPCEDAAGSTSLASGIIGGKPMTMVGDVSVAADSTAVGSAPLVSMATTATSSISGLVPTYPATEIWAIRALIKVGAAASSSALLRWHTTGTLTEWQIVLDPAGPTLKLEGYTNKLSEHLADPGDGWVDADGNDLYDAWVYYEVNVETNGTGVDWDYTFWYSAEGSGGNSSTEAACVIGNVQDIGVGYGWGASTVTDISVGHIAVSTDGNFPQDVGDGGDILTAFARETARIRFARVCDEESLPNTVLSPGGDTILLGAQRETSISSLLQDIEQAEGGQVFEGKAGDLTLIPHEYRHNRAVALTMDITAHQLAEPPQPTDDDRQLHNDVTVTRTGGSSARYADLPHIARNGGAVYADSATLNLAFDDDLLSHASWRVHLGTVEDLRYPQLSLNLARATSLIPAWLACDIGSRVQVTHPPAEGQPGTIDVHIEGYTEHITTREWHVLMNTSPALPWQVLTLDASANLGRLDTYTPTPATDKACYLLTGRSAGATSFTVASSAGRPTWSSAAVPYDWEVAGEQVTVTAVSNVTPSFVAVGTASHANNAAVTPGLPAGAQQDDLLLVYTAIRNVNATIDTPAGYELIIDGGSVALFGKIHTGTESAPTITFVGGAAGDDTSVQMCAFRGVQNFFSYSTSQANGSAQNIAHSVALPDRPGQMLLWLGWKQDDWTSAANLAAGITEIAEFVSTVGNDQGMVWNYNIQTNAAEFAAGSWVITGGAAAGSKSFILAFPGDVQIATVTRAVNGVSKAQAAETAVSLWRPGVISL